MPRHSKKTREEARRLFLTGEVTSNAEVARRVSAKPHTVAVWKQEEGWDGLRLKIERRAAEQMVEKIASDRVSLNSRHFKAWDLVVSQMLTALQKEGLGSERIRSLDKVAAILDRAQKGQRLARGLSLDGKTEEQIRAESEADGRALIDLFIEVVRVEVTDEQVRDRIARALLDRLPRHEALDA